MSISQLSAKEITYFFQENVLRPLTDRYKTIILIASAALGLLAACYLIKSRCFRATPGETVKEDMISSKGKTEIDSKYDNQEQAYQQPISQLIAKINTKLSLIEEHRLKNRDPLTDESLSSQMDELFSYQNRLKDLSYRIDNLLKNDQKTKKLEEKELNKERINILYDFESIDRALYELFKKIEISH